MSNRVIKQFKNDIFLTGYTCSWLTANLWIILQDLGIPPAVKLENSSQKEIEKEFEKK